MTTRVPSSMHDVLRTDKQPHDGTKELCTNGGTRAVVSAAEIAWLVAHLRAAVAASPTAWTGSGMTLLQLTALHVISAQAPVTLTAVATALGTEPPATSAMVDRLIRTGLVSRAPDPHDRRRVQLTITDHAKTMIGDIDLRRAAATSSMCSGAPYDGPPASQHHQRGHHTEVCRQARTLLVHLPPRPIPHLSRTQRRPSASVLPGVRCFSDGDQWHRRRT
jgi:DNA-binding MarR family transcriptional regulator